MAYLDCAVLQQDLESADASLVMGMLAPSRLAHLNAFLEDPEAPRKQAYEPSITTESLSVLSLEDKVATLSALPPAQAAAILGTHLHSVRHYS